MESGLNKQDLSICQIPSKARYVLGLKAADLLYCCKQPVWSVWLQSGRQLPFPGPYSAALGSIEHWLRGSECPLLIQIGRRKPAKKVKRFMSET